MTIEYREITCPCGEKMSPNHDTFTCPICDETFHVSCVKTISCDPCGETVCENCCSINVNVRGICSDANVCDSCREESK